MITISTVISFLLAGAPFIPILLQVAGILIKWFGTSEKNLRLFNEMSEANKDTGKAAVQVATDLDAQQAKIEAEIKAEREAKLKNEAAK